MPVALSTAPVIRTRSPPSLSTHLPAELSEGVPLTPHWAGTRGTPPTRDDTQRHDPAGREHFLLLLVLEDMSITFTQPQTIYSIETQFDNVTIASKVPILKNIYME